MGKNDYIFSVLSTSIPAYACTLRQYSIDATVAIIDLCVISTPFGIPVDPLVYIIIYVSSGSVSIIGESSVILFPIEIKSTKLYNAMPNSNA